MKIEFLGTGTSTGVPVVGCGCPVCVSQDPRDNRMRSSLLVESDTTVLVIDTGPEFRIQALRAGIRRVDGILLTHAHADHVHGLDDVRPLTQTSPVKIWGSQETLGSVRRLFPYFFSVPTPGTTIPQVTLEAREPGVPFLVGDLEVLPLRVYHGDLPIFGYRIGNMAYLTDCSRIPEETLALLGGLKVLILDSLRPRPHPTHFCEAQAVEAARKIGAKTTFFTHINHDSTHQEMLSRLPPSMEPAYDGLVVQVDR